MAEGKEKTPLFYTINNHEGIALGIVYALNKKEALLQFSWQAGLDTESLYAERVSFKDNCALLPALDIYRHEYEE